jgi:hypothetical protein
VVVQFGVNLQLLAKAFSALLQDASPLVRRGALDLMVQSFNSNFCHFSDSDFDILIPSALSVVLYKDVSLNRRLYQWIGGLDNHVVRALDSMLGPDEGDVYLYQKPYRILTALLDNAEYGERIFGRIFESVLDNLFDISSKNDSIQEPVYQVATAMLQSVHPFFMWKKIQFWTFDQSGKDVTSQREFYQRMEFMVNRFKFHEEEIQKVHLPLFYFTNCHFFKTTITLQFVDCLAQIRLLLALANAIPEHVWKASWTLSDFRRNAKESVHSPLDKQLSSPLVEDSIQCERFLTINDVKRIYSMDGSTSSKKFMETVSVGASTLIDAFKELISTLDFWAAYFKNEAIVTEEVLELWTKTQQLIRRHYTLHEDPNFLLNSNLGVLKDIALMDIHYMITSACLSNCYVFHRKSEQNSNNFLVQSFQLIWRYLSPEYQHDHEDALHLLQDLSDTLGNQRVQTQISISLLNKDKRDLQRFGVIWSYFENSNLDLDLPLIEMFYFLVSHDYEAKNVARVWFRSNLLNFGKLVRPLLKILLHREIYVVNTVSDGVWKPVFRWKFNHSQVIFALKGLIESLKLFQFQFVQYLCNTQWDSPTETMERVGISIQNPSIAEFIILISTILAIGTYSTILGDAEASQVLELRTVACDVIQVLGTFINAFSIPFHTIQIVYKSILCFASTSSGSHHPQMYSALKPYVPILYNPKHYQNHFGSKEAKLEIVNYMTKAILNEQQSMSIESWSDFVVAHLPYCKWEIQDMTIPLIKSVCVVLNSCTSKKHWEDVTSPIQLKLELLDFLELLLSDCLSQELLKTHIMEQFVGIFASFYQIVDNLNEYTNNTNERNATLLRISKSLKWVTNQDPASSFEVFVYCWIHIALANQSDVTMSHLVELTGVGPTTIVIVLLESLKDRSAGNPSKLVSDYEVLHFLLYLIPKVPNSSLGSIWATLMAYLREMNMLSANVKVIVSNLLPFVDKVFELASNEDRRQWKESSVDLID